ncbi:hypothetical protein KC340_g128 [Hortaea werneckii]|nr:hypothetical protein KC340_g128 [Hortaea werneckii]
MGVVCRLYLALDLSPVDVLFERDRWIDTSCKTPSTLADVVDLPSGDIIDCSSNFSIVCIQRHGPHGICRAHVTIDLIARNNTGHGESLRE